MRVGKKTAIIVDNRGLKRFNLGSRETLAQRGLRFCHGFRVGVDQKQAGKIASKASASERPLPPPITTTFIRYQRHRCAGKGFIEPWLSGAGKV